MSDISMKSLTLCINDVVEIPDIGTFIVTSMARPSDGSGRRHIRLTRKFEPGIELIIRNSEYMKSQLAESS